MAVVKDYPVPQSMKEVRQFLGITLYYRRFVQNFAKTAQPLCALMQKGTVFNWSASCQDAFAKLKKLLTEAQY